MAKGKYTEWLTENGLLEVEGWARDGLSNKQIAKDCIGISVSTLNEWMTKYPSFSEAIKKGRRPVKVSVQDAFYSRCDWQVKEEKRTEITIHPDGTQTKRIIKQQRIFPPDTGALIFALKNLDPEHYRDKPTVNDTKSDSEAFDDLLKVVNLDNFKKTS